MRYIIGLFGMTGSGKSTVCNFFEKQSWLIINQDLLGHEVLQEFPNKIAEMFGADVLDEGVVNRQKLGQKIFSNDKLRYELMNFSYQIIIKKTNTLISINPQKNVLIEGAFFFRVMEGIPYTHLMCISVPEDLLYDRLIKRGHNKEWIQRVIVSQQEIYHYQDKANFVIDNSQDRYFLIQQLKQVLLSLS
ncbi:MAG: dephospho-CoA kinase, partial [Brevinema sp.]